LSESHAVFASGLLSGNDFSIRDGNLRMSWVYLFLAGLFEIGGPVGIKISQAAETRWLGIAIAIIFMALCGYFLWVAQQNIPIGTAYASDLQTTHWHQWSSFLCNSSRFATFGRL